MLAALLVAVGMGTAWADDLPTPVYFNDFSSTDGLTIVGNGVFETDADARFGQVFHNDPTLTKAIRTNYLLLPSDVLSHSATTKEMTIGFWVNMRTAEEFYWSPMFAAYDNADRSANATEPWPHFALMARKEVALNCWGYCDLGNTFNDNGTNAQTSAWLDDKAWHYYTATLTATSVKVYIDGILENSWTFDGTTAGQIVEGVFNAGAEYATNDFGLKYICLGGNQACNWADPDPAFAFDDFAVYDKALTADQIKQVMEAKSQVLFDFSDPNFRENIGTALNDVNGNIYNETFTVDGTTLQITCGAAPTKIYVDANRGQNLVTYRDYTTLTFRAPEGMAITDITFTAAGNSNINSMTASSGNITGMSWTGNAEGVRFTQGATSYMANAIVTLAVKTTETAALPAITYTECANIAAFNALEVGTYAKITLTDAEITGKSADGYSTVFIQDASAGAWIQYTTLNDQLNEKTKVNGTVYTVKRVASGNPQLKEAEDTPNSSVTSTALSEYTMVEGTLAEVNVAANQNKVVKITGASFVATSATAGTLTQGDVTIDVNNGTATANQQLHKITDEWVKDETKMENVTIIAILVAKSASAYQLLPISMEEVAVSTADATFDFQNNPENWPVSEALFDDDRGVVTTLTANGVTLTSIQNNEWNANMIYKAEDADPVFRVAKENAFKLTAPEGKAIVKVVVTMAAASFDFTADNGEIAENTWTGNATEVTFTTTANRSISKIEVTLADENDETIKPVAAVEVATIADFNAVEDGKTVKLTLTNARVNGVMGGSYYVEDASGATVFKGLTLTPGTQLNGYVIGTKSTDDEIDFMNDPAVAVEYQLTATDATTFEASETTMEGTVMALTEAGTQANYGRLVTFEHVTISGSGQSKTLADANGNTFKARDYMGVLPTDYNWPEKASKITGIVIYYMTGWFLMPISADAIVEDTTQGIETINATTTESLTIYNLQGQRLNGLQKGINIVNGKKVVIK